MSVSIHSRPGVQCPGVQVAAGWRLSCSFNVATDELLQGLRAVQVTSDLQLRPADRTHPQCIHHPWRSGSATLTREPPTNTPSQGVGGGGGAPLSGSCLPGLHQIILGDLCVCAPFGSTADVQASACLVFLRTAANQPPPLWPY